jgi:hypothetical protein
VYDGAATTTTQEPESARLLASGRLNPTMPKNEKLVAAERDQRVRLALVIDELHLERFVSEHFDDRAYLTAQ